MPNMPAAAYVALSRVEYDENWKFQPRDKSATIVLAVAALIVKQLIQRSNVLILNLRIQRVIYIKQLLSTECKRIKMQWKHWKEAWMLTPETKS